MDDHFGIVKLTGAAFDVEKMLRVVSDGGFKIMPLNRIGLVRVSGALLPAECRETLCLLDVSFAIETYGSQSITRVAEVKVRERLFPMAQARTLFRLFEG